MLLNINTEYDVIECLAVLKVFKSLFSSKIFEDIIELYKKDKLFKNTKIK